MTERQQDRSQVEATTAKECNDSATNHQCHNSRMRLYKKREMEFIDFLNESQRSLHLPESPEETEERPLSGLQCLLALTEILDKAAQLRVANYDLEKRIEVLQKFKLVAEVQHELHNATADVSANGIVRSSRKTKSSEEINGGRLKRALSAESLDAFHSPKFDNSLDDFTKHRAGTGKGSKLSETWGRMKEKLAHKEPIGATPSTGKSRRHRSADIAGPVKFSLSADTPSPPHGNAAVQFTQREINISPPPTRDGDFGGVWLGDDAADAATDNDAMDFGGVYLGPPSIVYPQHDSQNEGKRHESASNAHRQHVNEKVERQASEPLGFSRPISKRDYHNKFSTNEFTIAKVKTSSYDELQKAKSLDNQSPTLRRKKSKLFAQAAHLLPGSEQKKMKKVENSNELPKEFRKKIEEWNIKKESMPTQETSDVTTSAKPMKASKSKQSQRFKTKKRSGLLKQRSKSAERMEDNSSQRHSDEFEEKLREWSLKQGYHASYYSDIRDCQRSAESIGEASSERDRLDKSKSKSENPGLAKGFSDNSLTVCTQSSCTDSASSLSPAPTVDSFHSAENLQTLYEISQSADIVFYRSISCGAKPSHKLSRSEEALSSTVTSNSLSPSIEQSATDSNVDLYARASDDSLEKHLSLYHVTSECSINNPAASSTECLEQCNRGVELISGGNRASNNLEVVIGEDVEEVVTKLNNINISESAPASRVLSANHTNLPELSCHTVSSVEISALPKSSTSKLENDRANDTLASKELNTVGINGRRRSVSSSQIDTYVANSALSSKENGGDGITSVDHTKPLESMISDPITSKNVKTLHSGRRSTGSTTDTPGVDNVFSSALSSDSTNKASPTLNNIMSSTLNDKNVSATVSNDSVFTTSNNDSVLPSIDNDSPSPTVGSSKESAIAADNNIVERTIENEAVPIITVSNDATHLAEDGDGSLEINDSAVDPASQASHSPSTVSLAENNNGAESSDTPSSSKRSYDINSNVTNGLNTSNHELMQSSTLYLGTEVPLKLRLKSLAMEYQLEDSKAQQNTAPYYFKNSGNVHKRTRSYDLFSDSRSYQDKYSSEKDNVHRSTSNMTNGRSKPSLGINCDMSKPTTLQQVGPIFSSNHSDCKQQRSNVHRLKSADELIYEKSPRPTRKHHTRQASVGGSLRYPRLEICNRRELYEKPKEGTVKKAMSMFRDNGTFNPQFGTDFNARPSPQFEKT